jgi:hypothetical protein
MALMHARKLKVFHTQYILGICKDPDEKAFLYRFFDVWRESPKEFDTLQTIAFQSTAWELQDKFQVRQQNVQWKRAFEYILSSEYIESEYGYTPDRDEATLEQECQTHIFNSPDFWELSYSSCTKTPVRTPKTEVSSPSLRMVLSYPYFDNPLDQQA